MLPLPAPAECSALTSRDAWHAWHRRDAPGVALVVVEHLGEETRPVKQDRRAVHVHAQVVVAVTNAITTACAIIPWFY
jgi:predicted amidohydrolase YtcJ